MRTMVMQKLPRMLSLCQRMLGARSEAEDVAQEVFVRVWQQAALWQPGAARFDTWLHRVALNLCYDRLRSRKDFIEHGPEHEAVDPAAAPDFLLQDLQGRREIGVALAALPVRQREALVLQYFQELPHGETAALMDISIEALESLLARARRTLRARFVGDGKEKP